MSALPDLEAGESACEQDDAQTRALKESVGRKDPLAAAKRVSAEELVQQCRGTLRQVLPEPIELDFEIEPQAEPSRCA